MEYKIKCNKKHGDNDHCGLYFNANRNRLSRHASLFKFNYRDLIVPPNIDYRFSYSWRWGVRAEFRINNIRQCAEEQMGFLRKVIVQSVTDILADNNGLLSSVLI